VEEVAAFLKVYPRDIVKTLIYETDQGPVAVLIRGDHEVNEVKVKNLLGATDLILAGPAKGHGDDRRRSGLCRPLGLSIPIYADQAVAASERHGHRGQQRRPSPHRVHPQRDLQFTRVADLRQVTEEDPCPRCGAP
jgi:prolyl-tRNA synthetase